MTGASFTDRARAFGIRAEPKRINWAVLEGKKERPHLHASGKETAPAAFDEAESLGWFRKRVIFILEQYNPTKVAIRHPERNSRGANTDAARARCRVEGVILEVANSKALEVVTGALNTVSKNLGSDSAKDYLESDEFRGLNWGNYANYLKEAILVAASVLPSD